MINRLIIICFMAVLLSGIIKMYAQQAEYIWVQNSGGAEDDAGYAVTTDNTGNIIMTGEFRGTANFNDTSLVSAGSRDFYIAKYSADGNLLWIDRGGGPLADGGYAVTTDTAGNTYIAGYFKETATFGDTTLISAGSTDILILKYDLEGVLLSVNQAGGTENDLGHGIAVDAGGSCYVTGYFEGSAIFGDSTYTGAGGRDIFIAKYDAEGNLQWVELAGGPESDQAYAIAADNSGNIIVTGVFKGTSSFGDTTMTSSDDFDIFIAKYDTGGNLIWLKQAGGVSSDIVYSIAVDNSGSCVLTGFFNVSATFENVTLTAPASSGDIFIVKYDSNGEVLWVEQAGGTNFEWGNAVSVDSEENIHITGSFSGTVSFGDTTITSAGSFDIFTAKYDREGNFLRVNKAGGTDQETGRGITADTSGNSIVTGDFQGSAIFGDTTVTSAGSSDIFMCIVGIDSSGNPTAIEDITVDNRPSEFTLSQNYPNPFSAGGRSVYSGNPATTIKYSIPTRSKQYSADRMQYQVSSIQDQVTVSLIVYDILGRQVAVLVNQQQSPGNYTVEFFATDKSASGLASGIYFYTLRAGPYAQTRKMMLMR